MIRDVDLLKDLPPWFRAILDFTELCMAEGEELELLAEAMAAVWSNRFFQTMDAGTVREWERIFHITPNPAAEALEFRRQRVLNRLATQPPFTLIFLGLRLDALVGPGAWTAEVDHVNGILYLEMAAADQSYAQEIAVTLDIIKPAHIVYISRPYTSLGLLLSQQIGMGDAVYNYQLGAWALGRLPFATLRDLGVISMPSQLSVQPALLSDTAGFVAEDVASVRLNGSVDIPGSALTRSTNGSTAWIEYPVSPGQVDEVSRVELLNAAGETLTDAAVYVPVVSEVRFKHKINVKEG